MIEPREQEQAQATLRTPRDCLRWGESALRRSDAFLGHGTDDHGDECLALLLHVLALPADSDPRLLDARLLPDEVSADKEAAQEAANDIVETLQAEYDDFRLDGNDNVSGKVSGEFRQTALYALLAAMGAIALYIWVRFEWQFGVGALFALFHDVSLTLGMFALFQLEFSLQIIAAILAIIGYSLNDTIVIYDRIRENLKKYRKMEVPALLDLSVNETLARTVMTSLTLLVALLPLLLFGPASLFGMVAAITLGLFVGTYSSVYSAAPILVWLGVTSDSFVPRESAADEQEKKARGLV